MRGPIHRGHDTPFPHAEEPDEPEIAVGLLACCPGGETVMEHCCPLEINKGILDVAFESGFESIPHFHRVLKNKTDETALLYRKINRAGRFRFPSGMWRS